MHRLFFRQSLLPRWSFEEEQKGLERTWQPEMDVFELPDVILLSLSVPGVPADDIDVALVGRTLVICGARNLTIPPAAAIHLIESSTGRFERRIRLPESADVEGIRTELANGQLLVHIPKTVARTVRVSFEETT